jgi:hypothetical protein
MTSESDNCLSVCTLWLVRWAFRAGTRDFYSALAAQVGLEKNIFSSTYIISILLPPSPSQLAGCRAGSPVS